QIAFNVVAQIGSESKDMPGYTSEEVKLGRETRKILGVFADEGSLYTR
ncbi:MAG: hypothetical protein IKH65_01700, partial [Clostridia bacterium]|nr:hypothetical protein [Clostridia bacterium]